MKHFIVRMAYILLATAALPALSADVAGEKFGDWGLSCAKGGEPDKPAETCALVQRLVREEGEQQIVKVEISKTPEMDGATMLLTVPLGVGLLAGAGFQIDAGELQKAPYNVCSGSGCHALFNVSRELVDGLKRGLNLTVFFVAVQGQTLKAQLSLKGLTAGLAALEAKDAAKKKGAR